MADGAPAGGSITPSMVDEMDWEPTPVPETAVGSSKPVGKQAVPSSYISFLLIIISACDLHSDILHYLDHNRGAHDRGAALLEIAFNVGCGDSDALE